MNNEKHEDSVFSWYFSDYESLSLSIISAFVGICCAYMAKAVYTMIQFCQNLLLDHNFAIDEFDPALNTIGLFVIVTPIVGISISRIITHYVIPEAKGHGIPEVMESSFYHHGYMRRRTIILKSLCSALTIGSGGSAGREGPVVQAGAALGSTLGQILRLDSRYMRILLACGATGAIAATFNTPIAAVLFSLELIVCEFKPRSFIPLVITSVFATVVGRTLSGDASIFLSPITSSSRFGKCSVTSVSDCSAGHMA